MIPSRSRPALRQTLRKAGYAVYFGYLNYFWPIGKPELDEVREDEDLRDMVKGLEADWMPAK